MHTHTGKFSSTNVLASILTKCRVTRERGEQHKCAYFYTDMPKCRVTRERGESELKMQPAATQ